MRAFKEYHVAINKRIDGEAKKEKVTRELKALVNIVFS